VIYSCYCGWDENQDQTTLLALTLINMHFYFLEFSSSGSKKVLPISSSLILYIGLLPTWFVGRRVSMTKYQQLITIFPLDIKSLPFRNELTTLVQILLGPNPVWLKSCLAKILLNPNPA